MNEQTSNTQITILVVDDQISILDLLSQGIQRHGYQCLTASSGEQALDILNTHAGVNVVLTDIQMPGMSGIELTDIVKTRHEADVIVMTGFTKNFAYEDVIAKGASDFIAKPVGIKELLTRIERVLREQQTLAQRRDAQNKMRQSLKKLRRILNQTVNALASALEKRDPYTAGHQQRTAALAAAIAAELGQSEEQVEGIYMAGMLHDMGKIAVPAEILTKPSRLSENEYNLIKEHPQVGYDILKNIEFDQPVAETVYQHHERQDGSGYPRGLGHDAIIPQAKIMAVADVVEALASHRPYRAGLGAEKALQEIIKFQGVLYDNDVAEACIRLFHDKKFTFD